MWAKATACLLFVIAALTASAQQKPAAKVGETLGVRPLAEISNSAASGDGPCRPQIAVHGSGPAPHNGIVMNGIDVLEQDGFREIRGSDQSSPRAVGVITNQTGFDVEGRRTIDILAKAPGIKLVAIFSPEHGVTGELDIDSVGDSVDRATGVHIYSSTATRWRAGIHPKACCGSWMS